MKNETKQEITPSPHNKSKNKGSLCSSSTLSPPPSIPNTNSPNSQIHISQPTTTYPFPPTIAGTMTSHPTRNPILTSLAQKWHSEHIPQPKNHLMQRTPTPPPPPPPKPKWIPPPPPPPTNIQILISLLKYLLIWSLILAYRYPSPLILVLGSTLWNTRYGVMMAGYGGWEHWVVLYIAVYMSCRWMYDRRYHCCDREIRRGKGRCGCRECRQWPREDDCCEICGYR